MRVINDAMSRDTPQPERGGDRLRTKKNTVLFGVIKIALYGLAYNSFLALILVHDTCST